MNESDFVNALNTANDALQSQTSYLNQVNAIALEKELSDEQKAWSEQMMDKQNAWTLDMWNRTNEYNSPKNQLGRLAEAGLNPLYFGLDGSSANGFQSAQALAYDRAGMKGFNNPGLSAYEASVKSAQISSIELDNELKRKQLDWYDTEHQQKFDFQSASIDEVRQAISESKSRIANNEMDTKLKAMDISKRDAEIATEVARCAGIGLDNALKEQINPLMVRAQELENQLKETRNQYEAERILAELAETRAHTAALYAQAALDGARKEGVDLDNVVKRAESKFAEGNAQNRANLLRWTANEERYKASYWHNTWKGKVSVDNYYAQHYEEAFRNSWSRSGVEWGIAENLGEGIGALAILGTILAF